MQFVSFGYPMNEIANMCRQLAGKLGNSHSQKFLFEKEKTKSVCADFNHLLHALLFSFCENIKNECHTIMLVIFPLL